MKLLGRDRDDDAFTTQVVIPLLEDNHLPDDYADDFVQLVVNGAEIDDAIAALRAYHVRGLNRLLAAVHAHAATEPPRLSRMHREYRRRQLARRRRHAGRGRR